jgi:threonine synthase
MNTHSRCAKCSGILTGHYDLTEGISFDLESIPKLSIWDFREMMPPLNDSNIVSMGEGWTPLIEAPRFGDFIGSENLLCKMEGQNPSGSFKDRAASLGLSLAKEWKKEGVFTASSGNAAAAVSAYSARAGIKCLVLIREDSTPSKLGQISMYGPLLLRVREIFKTKEKLAEALELTQKALPTWLNHFVWAPYNPLLIDGLKSIAYEIAVDAKGELPEYIFVPTAGGDLLYAIFKGFEELKTLGLVVNIPRMVVTQGKNAAPTVLAVESGASTVPEIATADTIAGALRVNFGTEHTLVAVRESSGFGMSVTDEEILDAQRTIAAKEGIFTEISSATALAAISKSIKEGKIRNNDRVLAILTGSGFKDYQPSFQDISSVPLAESSDKIPAVLKAKYSV